MQVIALSNTYPELLNRVPLKVRWVKDRSSTDLVETIPSKSTRAFFRAIPTLLTEQQYETQWQTDLSVPEFEQWLAYYQKKSAELDYTVFASSEWYERMKNAGHTISQVTISQRGEVVATGIIVEKKKQVSLAFKTSERRDLSSRSNTNLGTCIDFLFFQKYWEDARQLSGGISRNAFGVLNNLGHLDFKLRMGYAVAQPTQPNFKEYIELNQEGTAIFYAADEAAVLRMHILLPENQESLLDEIYRRYPLQSHNPKVLTYNIACAQSQ